MAGKPDTWMPLYWGDYLRDTMHLTTEGHGAYLLLIGAYWTGGGPLPDDDEHLMAVARLDAKAWKKLKPALSRFFTLADGLWRHKRIDAEIAKARGISEKRQAAGKAGGNARAANAANGVANAKQTAKQNPTPSQPPSPSPSIAQQGEAPPPPAEPDQAAALGLELLTMLGRADDPTWHCGPVHQWVANGWGADRIRATVRQCVSDGRAKRAKGLNYFTPIISEAVAGAVPSAPVLTDKYDPNTDPDALRRKRLIEAGRANAEEQRRAMAMEG